MPMATIFLSHSSRNGALTASVEAWLRRSGFTDLFVDHTIRSGDKWMLELRAAKASCRLVLCVVTPEWLSSDECFGEFMAAFYMGRRIIPLLCVSTADLDERQAKRLAKVLAEDQGVDLIRAGGPDALDLDAAPAVAEPLRAGLRAAGALIDVGLDPRAFEVDRAVRPEPFPGLESFGDQDADAAIFFGRDTSIAQCLEDLREMRANGEAHAYAMLGASGSGKSSLMKAGVLPRLRRERGWFVMRAFRPGADPLFELAKAITRTGADHGVELVPGAVRDDLRRAWREQADLLAALMRPLAPIMARADREVASVVIAVDQAEELARTGGDRGEGADAVAAYLTAAMSAPKAKGDPSPFLVAMTVRSDSFAELQAHPRLQGLTMRCADIRPLPFSRLASAIEQPAARYGVLIEPALVEALADDASGRASLPLLAFALNRLWAQYHAAHRIVPENYESIGKLSGLIDDAAERALRGIEPTGEPEPIGERAPAELERRAAHLFVPALASVNDAGAPVRRVARLDKLGEPERAILGHFDRWRLVVVDGDHAEVAHEAMFREWPRFREWLEPEKARLETLRGVEAAAAVWRARGAKPEDLVHRGKRLREARALDQVDDYRAQLDGDPHARDYLAAAEASERRQRVRTAVASAALAIVVGALSLAAYHGYEQGVTHEIDERLMRNDSLAGGDLRYQRYAQAIALYQANVGLAQRLAARDPGNGRWRYDVVLERAELGFALMRRGAPGDRQLALAQYLGARDALRDLPAMQTLSKDLRAYSAVMAAWIPSCIATLERNAVCQEPH
jgi:hypothetical protein